MVCQSEAVRRLLFALFALALTLGSCALADDVIRNNPRACQSFRPYCQALQSSGVKVLGTGLYIGNKFFVDLPDQQAADAFLDALRQRGLDPARVELMLARPAQLPEPSRWPDTTQVVTRDTPAGYEFTLTVTRRGLNPVTYQPQSCEAAYIERVPGGERVWQDGSGFCAGVGILPATLAPGHSVSRTVRWDGQNSLGQRQPGLYRVRIGLGPFVGETVFVVK